MSCLTATITRIGGLEAGVAREGGLSAVIERQSALEFSAARVGGLSGSIERIESDTFMDVSPVCDVDLKTPYLALRPEIVWVLDGWTSNDVFSNTTWDID